MGIYIKGMEMPRDCGSCPLRTSCIQRIYCESTIQPYIERRPDYCPIVPVPPHGDLIDRDAIPYNKIMLEDDDFYYGVTKPYIDRMPTVIEAEGKE